MIIKITETKKKYVKYNLVDFKDKKIDLKSMINCKNTDIYFKIANSVSALTYNIVKELTDKACTDF